MLYSGFTSGWYFAGGYRTTVPPLNFIAEHSACMNLAALPPRAMIVRKDFKP